VGNTHLSFVFFSSRRRHTRSLRDWSSDVCSSDLESRRRLAPPFRLGKKEGRDAVATRGRGPDGGEGVEHALGAAAVQETPRCHEIGRAACRERGGMWVGVGAAKT